MFFSSWASNDYLQLEHNPSLALLTRKKKLSKEKVSLKIETFTVTSHFIGYVAAY